MSGHKILFESERCQEWLINIIRLTYGNLALVEWAKYAKIRV
jgi:hypothetical protein